MCIHEDKPMHMHQKHYGKYDEPSKDEYTRYHLSYDTRVRIISLGISKRPTNHQYRRSKSGQKLFHYIAIISRRLKDTPTNMHGIKL